MKKIIFIFISVLLLVSCSQGQIANGNVSAPPTAAAQTPVVSAPSPSPSQGFVSCKEGEKVSEYFYTGDLERFFDLIPREIIPLLGDNYGYLDEGQSEDDYIIQYKSLGIVFYYISDDEDETSDDEDETSDDEDETNDSAGRPVLKYAVISDFDFHGLNASSNFDDVTKSLGETEILTIRGEDNDGEGYYYYALRYIIGALRFEFSSVDEKSSGGLTLTITPSSGSQAFYISCKKGDSISKTITTEDIIFFMKTPPEELFNILGNSAEIVGYVDDYDVYVAPCDYLGISLQYTCDVDWEEELEIPKLPIKRILLYDFNFRGLSNESTFKDVMKALDKTKIRKGYAEDSKYYYLKYKLYGMWFEFSGSDKQGSDGVGLSISPAN